MIFRNGFLHIVTAMRSSSSADRRRQRFASRLRMAPLSLVFSATLLVLVPAAVTADVTIQIQDGNTTDADPLLSKALVDSNILSDFVQLVEENFLFDPPLVLAIGANEGPDYDYDTHVLRMPFSYLGRAVETQAELVEDREEALRRGLDIVEYTLYHLLGHALIDDPAVEADGAAEALSSWVMLSHWRNGEEQWHQAARIFAEASQKLDGPLEDFWHTHSLYRARHETIECWILGSDPETYAKLLPTVLKTASRAEECAESWRKLHRESLKELDDLLLDTAPIRDR